MRSMKRIIQSAVIVFVFVMWAPAGYACWCIKPEVKEAFDRAKVVFVGEVLEVIPPRSTAPRANFEDAAHTVKFKVETAWKQTFLTEARVLMRTDSCFGLRTLPEKGDKYLVYAEPVYRDDASRTELMTHGCTRTARLSEMFTDGFFYRNQAADDIRMLNNFLLMFWTRSGPSFSPPRLQLQY
jgi:hypothetical protein